MFFSKSGAYEISEILGYEKNFLTITGRLLGRSLHYFLHQGGIKIAKYDIFFLTKKSMFFRRSGAYEISEILGYHKNCLIITGRLFGRSLHYLHIREVLK